MRSSSRWTPILIALSLVAAGVGLLPAGATHDPSLDPEGDGTWLHPFAENAAYGNGAGGGAPPDTAAESAELPTAVSIVVLPNGNVLYWNGVEGSENITGPAALGMVNPEVSRTRVLNLSGYFDTGALPQPTQVPNPWSPTNYESLLPNQGDMFCADLRHLADGRVLVVGGTNWVTQSTPDVDDLDGVPGGGPIVGRVELYGRRNARIYDPATGTWSVAALMSKRRWYPALVTLPDGRKLVAGGVEKLLYNTNLDDDEDDENPAATPPDASPMNVRQTEIFDGTAWTLLTGAGSQTSLPLFARLHLMPNGKVLFDGTGQTWSPFGQDRDQAEWNRMKWFDPDPDANPNTNDGAWQDAGLAPLGARSGVFSVLLPLAPNSTQAKVLIGGGTLSAMGSPGAYLGTAISQVLLVSGDTVTGEPPVPMNNVRWYSSGVVLPTGEVIALSGADRDEVVDPGAERAVRQAEMYDPVTGSWVPLANGARDRTYHNSAVLLKDGSILVGGHSPIPAHYGPHANYAGEALANNFKDPSFEIFKPPYLFRGPRPTIASVVDQNLATPGVIDVAPGSSVTINTPDAGTIQKVVFSRLPATTHVTDADQRTVEVAITGQAGGSVTAQVPASGAILPSGYYYVFLVRTNTNEGFDRPTASKAAIVRVS